MILRFEVNSEGSLTTYDIAEALTSPESFSFASLYNIAGRRLLVEVDTESKWAVDFVRAFLDGFHLEPAPLDKLAFVDLRLNVSEAEPPPLPHVDQKAFEIPGGVCRVDGRQYVLDVAGGRVEVAPRDEARVSVWLNGKYSKESRRTSSITIMSYALPAALRRCGLYDLHACGMVERESESGFLFPGASASGKTTIALRLASTGWHYMSDDLLTISDQHELVGSYPLRRHFQPDDATLEKYEDRRLDAALSVRIPNDPSKRKMDPSISFPGQLKKEAIPRVLCFPTIAIGAVESKIETISRASAMSRLITMCPWSRYDLSGAHEHLRLLEKLVRQCRTYVLRAGRDILDDPIKASNLITGLAKV